MLPWVYLVSKQGSSTVSCFSGRFEAYGRVGAQGESLFFSAESVFKSPEFPASGCDFDIQPFLVIEPIIFGVGLGFLYLSVGECHAGGILRS